MRKRSRSPTTPDLLAQVAQRGAPEHPFLSTPWLLYTDRQRWGYLTILFVVAASQFFDRNIMSVLLEPIRHEFHVSDTMLGLLSGLCFALFYSVAGIPVARWADRGNRRTIITLALAAWSVMTLVCGLAQAFWQLALARVLVGVGESGGLPPSQSLIADYFSPERRATAIASFTAAAIAGNLLGIGVEAISPQLMVGAPPYCWQAQPEYCCQCWCDSISRSRGSGWDFRPTSRAPKPSVPVMRPSRQSADTPIRCAVPCCTFCLLTACLHSFLPI